MPEKRLSNFIDLLFDSRIIWEGDLDYQLKLTAGLIFCSSCANHSAPPLHLLLINGSMNIIIFNFKIFNNKKLLLLVLHRVLSL